MARERYLLNAGEDTIHQNEIKLVTGKDKRKNWWYYHKVHLLVGIIVVGLVGSFIYSMVTKVNPDYTIGLLTSYSMPSNGLDQLEQCITPYADDRNGDGQVVVRLNQYVMGDSSGEGAVYAYAGSTRLMADLEARDSCFFLLENPAAFQENYQILRRLDGSLPKETGQDYESCYLCWSDCPVLQALPLGEYTEKILNQELRGDSQALLAPLFVARRGFWTEHTCSYSQECDALWDEITRGRIQ